VTGNGLRQERVTFQQRSVDANGDRLGDWEDGFKRWVRVLVLRGGEPVMQARLQGQQPVQVTALARDQTRTVTTAWRMVWKGLPYNIKSIAPGERRDEIVFLADWDQSDA
jgi:head-tail adaptor